MKPTSRWVSDKLHQIDHFQFKDPKDLIVKYFELADLC